MSGRNKVWDIAFPQGWLPPVYTENDSGVIFARWSNTEKGRPMGAVTQFDGTFDPGGEGGLMGIALEPRLQRGHRPAGLRVLLDHHRQPRRARFDLDLLGPPYTAISNWTPIVTGLPHASFHDGCRVRFQPGTGALFVSTGDAATATAPQSTTVLGGKILRVDMNGAPWPGNVSGSRWYTRGHRNPQGLAFRPGSNDPYSVEHGPDVNDEVNKLVNGANSGWNPNNGGGIYDQSKPMTDSTLEPGNTMTPVWQSGGVTVAPSGGTFLSGPQWRAWDGALVVACLDGSPSVGPTPPRHAPERRRHRAHGAPGHRTRQGRAPARRGAGPGRQPLRRHRRQQRCRRDLEGRPLLAALSEPASRQATYSRLATQVGEGGE